MRTTLLLFLLSVVTVSAQPAWETKLDSDVRFYDTTDFGIVVAGTDKRLYAIDGQTGSQLWRLKTGKINATAVTPIPGTDLILLTHDLGSKSRLDAVDLLTGESIWQSDKVKGDVMQLAVEPESDLLVVVLVKDPSGSSGGELKRKPVVHVLKLSTGDELWKRDLDGEIEMMPASYNDEGKDVAFTLDNYHAPLFLDGRLYLFYEGATSYDARTGGEKNKEKFKINESGLALTESDAVADATHIYTSGRGRIRAVSRKTGDVDWKSDDLGVTPEIALANGKLIVRTGGQFTRIKDGEVVSKGPYGISAIDPASGKTLWRYKGADKGLTNFAFADAGTIAIADRDDVLLIDANSGKRKDKFEHKIEKAQFVLVNEGGRIVVGGQEELAAFDRGRELWRVRHKAPARGILRIVGSVALRAAAIYFRYGSLATSAYGFASGGLQAASAINSFRWSGLSTHFGSLDLTTLATGVAKNYVSSRIYTYGSLARNANAINRVASFDLRANIASRVTPSRADVEDSVVERLDPAHQADRLADFLMRKKRLAELRENYMYFYTDLDKPFSRKGLVGVNVHTGQDSRFVLASDPDREFTIDESLGLLYSSDGSKLQAFGILNR